MLVLEGVIVRVFSRIFSMMKRWMGWPVFSARIRISSMTRTASPTADGDLIISAVVIPPPRTEIGLKGPFHKSFFHRAVTISVSISHGTTDLLKRRANRSTLSELPDGYRPMAIHPVPLRVHPTFQDALYVHLNGSLGKLCLCRVAFLLSVN